jgi:coenzyme F420 hydrogenase subunit beta
MEKELPTIRGRCILCEACVHSCPMTEPGLIGAIEELEHPLFGQTGEGPIGIYNQLYAVRSTMRQVLNVAQDGGAVTAILMAALREGHLDAVVTSGLDRENPWLPIPVVVHSPEELIKCAGSRYTTSPNLVGLNEAVKRLKHRRVALVGVPCEITAARKMQVLKPKEVADMGAGLTLTIALFCMEALWYDQLINSYLKEEKGLDLSKITKFDISKGRFLVYSGDRVLLNVPLREVKTFARSSCHSCPDLTGWLADLSMGAMGSDPGWTTVIVRTKAGARALATAQAQGLIQVEPITEEGFAFLLRMAAKKLERAYKAERARLVLYKGREVEARPQVSQRRLLP